jgi:hypothetical protein
MFQREFCEFAEEEGRSSAEEPELSGPLSYQLAGIKAVISSCLDMLDHYVGGLYERSCGLPFL